MNLEDFLNIDSNDRDALKNGREAIVGSYINELNNLSNELNNTFSNAKLSDDKSVKDLLDNLKATEGLDTYAEVENRLKDEIEHLNFVKFKEVGDVRKNETDLVEYRNKAYIDDTLDPAFRDIAMAELKKYNDYTKTLEIIENNKNKMVNLENLLKTDLKSSFKAEKDDREKFVTILKEEIAKLEIVARVDKSKLQELNDKKNQLKKTQDEIIRIQSLISYYTTATKKTSETEKKNDNYLNKNYYEVIAINKQLFSLDTSKIIVEGGIDLTDNVLSVIGDYKEKRTELDKIYDEAFKNGNGVIVTEAKERISKLEKEFKKKLKASVEEGLNKKITINVREKNSTGKYVAVKKEMSLEELIQHLLVKIDECKNGLDPDKDKNIISKLDRLANRTSRIRDEIDKVIHAVKNYCDLGTISLSDLEEEISKARGNLVKYNESISKHIENRKTTTNSNESKEKDEQEPKEKDEQEAKKKAEQEAKKKDEQEAKEKAEHEALEKEHLKKILYTKRVDYDNKWRKGVGGVVLGPALADTVVLGTKATTGAAGFLGKIFGTSLFGAGSSLSTGGVCLLLAGAGVVMANDRSFRQHEIIQRGLESKLEKELGNYKFSVRVKNSKGEEETQNFILTYTVSDGSVVPAFYRTRGKNAMNLRGNFQGNRHPLFNNNEEEKWRNISQEILKQISDKGLLDSINKTIQSVTTKKAGKINDLVSVTKNADGTVTNSYDGFEFSKPTLFNMNPVFAPNGSYVVYGRGHFIDRAKDTILDKRLIDKNGPKTVDNDRGYVLINSTVEKYYGKQDEFEKLYNEINNPSEAKTNEKQQTKVENKEMAEQLANSLKPENTVNNDSISPEDTISEEIEEENVVEENINSIGDITESSSETAEEVEEENKVETNEENKMLNSSLDTEQTKQRIHEQASKITKELKESAEKEIESTKKEMERISNIFKSPIVPKNEEVIKNDVPKNEEVKQKETPVNNGYKTAIVRTAEENLIRTIILDNEQQIDFGKLYELYRVKDDDKKIMNEIGNLVNDSLFVEYLYEYSPVVLESVHAILNDKAIQKSLNEYIYGSDISLTEEKYNDILNDIHEISIKR